MKLKHLSTHGGIHPLSLAVLAAAICLLIILNLSCFHGASKEKIEAAKQHETSVVTMLTVEFAADPATIVTKYTDVCGTVQTDVTFRKMGAKDDGKEHSATFSGYELKYLDGQPYTEPLEQKGS